MKLKSFELIQNLFDNALHGIACDFDVAVRAEDFADLGKEEPEVIINFGGCSNRGAGILDGIFLFDCDGRGDSMDGLDIRPVHFFQELPGISGERFDVTSLAFRKQGVKGKCRFARSGDTSDDGDLASWNFAVDILEVVGFCANDFDKLFHRNISQSTITLRPKIKSLLTSLYKREEFSPLW